MSWRQLTRYSGFNMLTLGIVYETASPLGRRRRTRVLAYATKIIPQRFDPEQGREAASALPTASRS